MKVIIFADRIGRELAPLNNRTCVALLPVAGKRMIDYSIESLAAAGIREATVVISRYSDATKQALGNGQRWGMDFDYVLTRGEEDPDHLLHRLGLQDEAEILALRGDVIRSPVVKQFIDQAAEHTGTNLIGTIGGARAGLALTRNGSLQDLGVEYVGEAVSSLNPTAEVIDFSDAGMSWVNSLQEFHSANLEAASGNLRGLMLPARPVGNNLMIGRASRVSPTSVSNGPVFVGSRCNVHPSAALGSGAVLSEHVIVDQLATVQSSVVLPDTYVGSMTDLSDMIVWGNELIDVETGAVSQVTDSFLLAALQSGTLGAGMGNTLNRVLGGTALVASLPLWPLAFLVAMISNPSAPRRLLELKGNRVAIDPQGDRTTSHVRTWEFRGPIPLLRHLPKLWAVTTGDLRLVGTTPLSPIEAEQRTDDWQFVRDTAPAGLIGPAVLEGSRQADFSERLMFDAFYARQRSTSRDFGYLLKGVLSLLSPRAWFPARG